MARPVEIKNRKMIILNPSNDYKIKFVLYAKLNAMNQREFFQLLIDDYEKGMIVCRACGNPIADPRTINLNQVVDFVCTECKAETKYDLEKHEYVE